MAERVRGRQNDWFPLASYSDWPKLLHLNIVRPDSILFFMIMGRERNNEWNSIDVINTGRGSKRHPAGDALMLH
jgi:hypothetical protein